MAARLYDDALRVGLPDSAAWALTCRGVGDDATAADVEEPAVRERIGEVFGTELPARRSSRPR